VKESTRLSDFAGNTIFAIGLAKIPFLIHVQRSQRKRDFRGNTK
jgi:hypothetical protein